MTHSRDGGRVFVNVAGAPLAGSVTEALAAAGLEVGRGLPSEAPRVWALVEDALGSEEAVRRRVDELAEAFVPAPPLILVAGEDCRLTRAAALLAGADELATWPRDERELVAKACALLRRRALDLDAHPLTGLPGAAALHHHIQERLPLRGRLAVLSFDLRHFKAYNDRYGFARGDEVIQFVADLLKSVAMTEEIAYHVGGDDFILVTDPARVEGIAHRAVEVFNREVARFYDEGDRKQGFIVGLSRETGDEVRFPLLSLTIACATNEADDIAHVGQMAQVLAELKEYAKRQSSIVYARDRRRVHDAAASLELRAQLGESDGVGS